MSVYVGGYIKIVIGNNDTRKKDDMFKLLEDILKSKYTIKLIDNSGGEFCLLFCVTKDTSDMFLMNSGIFRFSDLYAGVSRLMDLNKPEVMNREINNFKEFFRTELQNLKEVAFRNNIQYDVRYGVFIGGDI